MTSKKPAKEFKPGGGYTRADWDEVSDSPEITPEEMAKAKPFAEVFPQLAESIKRSAGRPRKPDAKQAVTLRLHPDTVARFKARGDDWRSAMAEALDKAG